MFNSSVFLHGCWYIFVTISTYSPITFFIFNLKYLAPQTIGCLDVSSRTTIEGLILPAQDENTSVATNRDELRIAFGSRNKINPLRQGILK